MTTNRLSALQDKRATKVKELRALIDTVDASGEDLTDDQVKQKEAIKAEIDRLDASIKEEQELQALEAQKPAKPKDPVITGGAPAAENDPKHGFKSFGEFATVVRSASRKANPVYDERLSYQAAVPTNSANESVGEEGGYTVPPEYRAEIMKAVDSEESLFSRTDQIPIERNSVKMPVDETTDWDTTNGIQAYWEDELDQMQTSKPKLDSVEWTARKVTALVPVSSELLEDSSAMDAYLRRRAPAKIQFKVDLAIVRGTGVGQPLGFLNSPALITVAKEGSQAADTIQRENIDKMWMRMPAPRRRNAMWLINQDAEAQLQSLSFTGTESPMPVYLPNGGYSGQPFDTLKGRPVIYHQATSTLGDVGDISLVDMSQYATVVKQGGVRADVSMHLYFDADALAYRFILRVGGHPWLSSPISPRAGSNTLSPFVTLAERA